MVMIPIITKTNFKNMMPYSIIFKDLKNAYNKFFKKSEKKKSNIFFIKNKE